MDRETADALKAQDDKLACLEQKLDDVLELVSLGKHLAMFAKFLGWLGGAYIAVETYLRTVLHR